LFQHSSEINNKSEKNKVEEGSDLLNLLFYRLLYLHNGIITSVIDIVVATQCIATKLFITSSNNKYEK